MNKPVYNPHSAAQIFQKSRWLGLGIIASALASCRWLLSSRNKYRITDPSTSSQIYVAIASLETALNELRNRKNPPS